MFVLKGRKRKNAELRELLGLEVLYSYIFLLPDHFLAGRTEPSPSSRFTKKLPFLADRHDYRLRICQWKKFSQKTQKEMD